jgi:hypothetical protein
MRECGLVFSGELTKLEICPLCTWDKELLAPLKIWTAYFSEVQGMTWVPCPDLSDLGSRVGLEIMQLLPPRYQNSPTQHDPLSDPHP